MKNMFESPEVFEAYATIDYCHYMIEEVYRGISKGKTRSPIDIMIDEATGFSAAKTKERIKTLSSLLRDVIKNKKIVEADYTADQKLLDELKEINKNIKPKNVKKKP